MSDIQDDLAGALPITANAIEAVDEEQWTRSSTCQDWTVRELVEHLVGGAALTASVLVGDAAQSRPDMSRVKGTELANTFTEAGGEVLKALADPETLQRTVHVGMGPVPAVVAAQLCLVETLVHGWDVARSTGQDVRFAEDAVERALAFSQTMMSQIPEGRSPFAQAVEPPRDASALDRLVSLLGRDSY